MNFLYKNILDNTFEVVIEKLRLLNLKIVGRELNEEIGGNVLTGSFFTDKL